MKTKHIKNTRTNKHTQAKLKETRRKRLNNSEYRMQMLEREHFF